MSKVESKENCCFIKRKDIHFMHISILQIVTAFEELQKKFLQDKGDTASMNTPLDLLEILEQRPATRTSKAKMARPTKTTHLFLFRKDRVFEITGAMVTTKDTLCTAQPKLKTGQETLIGETLGLVSVSRLKAPKLSVLSQSCSYFDY